MARIIKFNEIADYCEDQFNKLLKVTVLEADSRLKQASPVDTGRLRVSWAIGENAAPYAGAPAGSASYPTPSNPLRIGYEKEKIGNIYSVHNNLPYAEPVLMGSNLPRSWQGQWRSKGNQIEVGYPLVIAKDMKDFIQTNATIIGRQS